MEPGKVDWKAIHARKGMKKDSTNVSKAVLWKAIRAHCIDCSGDLSTEADHCACTDCNLYPYRAGRRGLKGNIKTTKHDIGQASPAKESQNNAINSQEEEDSSEDKE